MILSPPKSSLRRGINSLEIGRISAPLEAEMTDDDLTHSIIGCAYKVHNTLGPGFLEKVYKNALRIELEKAGFRVKQQEPINVVYDGRIVGQYYADLWFTPVGAWVITCACGRSLVVCATRDDRTEP